MLEAQKQNISSRLTIQNERDLVSKPSQILTENFFEIRQGGGRVSNANPPGSIFTGS
jgi:hypothetical protein